MNVYISDLQKMTREINEANGWFDADRPLSADIALLHSEVTEAYEAYRRGDMDHFGEELADVLIRLLDTVERYNIDLTREKMTWTRLNYKPKAPVSLGLKEADPGQKNLENLGGLMQAMAVLMGKKQVTPLTRGFVGVELTERDGVVTVQKVLPRSPAARAGLKKGDRIREVQGEAVSSTAAVRRRTARLTEGGTLRLSVLRGEERKEIRITAGEGL